MSNETRGERPLSAAERALIEHLLREPHRTAIVPRLDVYRVVPMDDGGMGSVRVVGSEGRTLGTVAAECESYDIDGTPLSITVNLDQVGELFEIDIWRVDFKPLKRFPPPEHCIIVPVRM